MQYLEIPFSWSPTWPFKNFYGLITFIQPWEPYFFRKNSEFKPKQQLQASLPSRASHYPHIPPYLFHIHNNTTVRPLLTYN